MLGSVWERAVGRCCAQGEAELLPQLPGVLTSLLCSEFARKRLYSSPYLFIHSKYLFHLAWKSEVGHSVPIAALLSLYYLYLCLSLLTLASFLPFLMQLPVIVTFGCGVQKLWGLGQ